MNSFSKSWLMTGWRLGWMVLPAAVTDDLGKLIEYNTSCAPSFVQEAGVVAVRDGEDFIRDETARLRAARDHLVTAPGAARVDVRVPEGAMYAFFRIPGRRTAWRCASSWCARPGSGSRPAAFGPEGEGFVRWCYACDVARLATGVERLREFLRV